MKKQETIRLILFILFHIILLYFVVGYTIERCGVTEEISYVSDGVIIDGSEFPTILTNAFVFLTNGLVDFLINTSYFVITTVVTVILFLPFSLISLDKIRTASKMEKTITFRTMIFSWVAAYLGCAIYTVGESLIFILLLMVPPVLAEIIYYRVLRNIERSHNNAIKIQEGRCLH